MTSKAIDAARTSIEADGLASTLDDLSEYLVADRQKLGISDQATFLITEHLDKAAELIRAVDDERVKAIEELTELEDDLDSLNMNNPKVEAVYLAGEESGYEIGIEAAIDDEYYDDGRIDEANMRDVLAYHMNTTEYDSSVYHLLAGLQDRHVFANDQKAQAALAMLAREVLGDEFFNGDNDDDE